MPLPSPKSWTFLGIVRWLSTAIATVLIGGIADENVRHLAEERHWDDLLTRALARMPDLSPLFVRYYFWFGFGVSVGLAGALWLVRILGREPRARAPEFLADGASLKVLLRRDQDAQEISKENVYRWFIQSHFAKDADTGEVVRIDTQIFVVFDTPIKAGYRSLRCSRAGAILNVRDYTNRSVIVGSNDDLTDTVVELRFSGNPL